MDALAHDLDKLQDIACDMRDLAMYIAEVAPTCGRSYMDAGAAAARAAFADRGSGAAPGLLKTAPWEHPCWAQKERKTTQAVIRTPYLEPLANTMSLACWALPELRL